MKRAWLLLCVPPLLACIGWWLSASRAAVRRPRPAHSATSRAQAQLAPPVAQAQNSAGTARAAMQPAQSAPRATSSGVRSRKGPSSFDKRQVAKHAIVEQQGRAAEARLDELDRWFSAKAPADSWADQAEVRRSRVRHWADQLGLSVVDAECRTGACRLELQPAEDAGRHTIVRPLPRVRRLGGRAIFIRLPELRTVIFAATDGKRLPG